MQRASILALLAAVLLAPVRAAGQSRIYLSKAEVELVIVGKSLLSTNLSSGRVSHWRFWPNGSVEAASLAGLGQASGTWNLHEDGRMCVAMMGRSGCRYWFREGDAYANAESREPGARTVAVVRIE
jgi:hypothetical protein